jgi:hypothetical protein
VAGRGWEIGNKRLQALAIRARPFIARIPIDKTIQVTLKARTIRQWFEAVTEMLKNPGNKKPTSLSVFTP